MPERRVPERAPPLELLREEPGDVVTGSEAERPGVGLEGLDDHAPRCIAAAAAGELGDQLERSLLGAEVREREADVGVHDRREVDTRRSDGPSQPSACRRAPSPASTGTGRALRRGGRGSRRRPSRDGSARAPEADAQARARAVASRRRAERRPGIRTQGSARTPPPRSRSDGSGARRPDGARARRRSRGHRRVAPQVLQCTAGTTPRLFRSRIARPRRSETRASSSSNGADSGYPLSRRRSTTRTRGRSTPRRPPSSRCSSECQLSGRGVALPYTATAPSSDARFAATVRAS